MPHDVSDFQILRKIKSRAVNDYPMSRQVNSPSGSGRSPTSVHRIVRTFAVALLSRHENFVSNDYDLMFSLL